MRPYTRLHGIDGLLFTYYNEQAVEWYNPLKPYTRLEYEWVRENIELTRNTVVVDAGCHHGNYAVVFYPAHVIAVDSAAECCFFADKNLDLNGMPHEIVYKELGSEGVLTDKRIDVYKADIEGAEFDLFPGELYHYPDVHTWIVECHPKYGDPNTIATHFDNLGFALLKVDREQMKVRPYELGEAWPGHATLIAVRHP